MHPGQPSRLLGQSDPRFGMSFGLPSARGGLTSLRNNYVVNRDGVVILTREDPAFVVGDWVAYLATKPSWKMAPVTL
jgi:hypothetical protein